MTVDMDVAKLWTINQQALLTYHDQLVNEAQSNYNLPNLFQIKKVAVRKDTEVICFSAAIERWVKLFIERYGQVETFNLFKKFQTDIIKDYLLPRLETYYGAKVKHSFCFQASFNDNIASSFCVKRFDAQIFKAIDAQQSYAEEKIAAAISRYIRQSNGRGPERVAAAVLDNCKMVVFYITGLLSPFKQEYASGSSKNSIAVSDMLTALIDKGVSDVILTEYQVIPKVFTGVDFDGNLIVSLAILPSFID